MTDRVRTLTVTLDKQYRVDDIKKILIAIRMIGPVASVTAKTFTHEAAMAMHTAKADLKNKVAEAILEIWKDEGES